MAKYDTQNILGSLLEGQYRPVSHAPQLDTHVPDSMDEEIHKVLARLRETVGDIDEYVRRRLAYRSKQELYKALSAEQIDAVALAIYNLEIKGEGLIIADQTGIGKGRVAAAILRYAHLIGKRPIFLTIKSDLFSDIYRDLNAIRMDDLVAIKEPERNPDGSPKVKYYTAIDPETGEEIVKEREPKYIEVEPDLRGKKRFVPFILNNDVRIKDSKGNIIYESGKKNDPQRQRELQKAENFDLSDYDVILATYSQFNSKNNKILQMSKQDWLARLAEDNIVVMDEAHTVAGNVPSSWEKHKVNQALFFRNILPTFKGVVYLSATYAKFPENMVIYYFKTAMNRSGLKASDFVDVVKTGGVALQEIISAQLVESGNLIRRERPLGNIKFHFHVLEKQGQLHRAIFDKFTEILRDIIMFQREYITEHVKILEKQAQNVYSDLEQTRSSDLGFKFVTTPIFVSLFQIVNQLVFSLKAKEIGQLAVHLIKQGKKPVITFQNTMQALIEEIKSQTGKTVISVDYKQVLLRALGKTLYYREKIGSSSELKVIKLTDLKPEAQEEYQRIKDKIERLQIGISISPLDIIKETITEHGYKVGEITKRKLYVKHLKGGKGKVITRKIETATDIARRFNNNELDAVLLNESGSTGISLHAIETDKVKGKQVKQRVMIMAQPPLDINQFIQMLGRINRSGQVLKPEYYIISLAVPAETRLMIMLQRKLRSLDANVSSNQKNSKQVIDVPDFFNKYGGEVVINWLMNNDEIAEILGNPHLDKEGKIKRNGEEVARMASGRIAILPTTLQEQFYNQVIEEYLKLRDELIKRGEWDLEVSHLPLDAKILEHRTIAKGSNPDIPFGADTVLLKCDVKNLRKPMKRKEIEQMTKDYVTDKDLLLRELEEFFDTERQIIIDHYNAKYEEMIRQLLEKGKKNKADVSQAVRDLENERNEITEKKVSELRDNYLFFKTVFKGFEPGKGYEVPTGDKIKDDWGNEADEYADAIFIGYKFGGSPKKFVPSNVTMRFALAHPKRFIDFKFTSSYRNLIEDSKPQPSVTLDAWDDLIKDQSNAREVRYIIVGNIVGAMKRNKGQLANIKFHDGTRQKALLLSRKFQPPMQTRVPISQTLDIILNLSEGASVSSDSSSTKFDGIKIKYLGYDRYRLEIPSAKNEAAQFFVPEVLNLIIGGEFEKLSGRWQAQVSRENIPQLIQVLDRQFSIRVKVSETHLEQIARQQSQIKSDPLLELFAQAISLAPSIKKAV